MSVLDNIMAGRNLRMHATFLEVALQLPRARREETESREAVEEIIEFLEIEHIRKTPVARLPYGLQKRVELGRALAAEPTILLLDEPMAGMNIEEKQDMCRFILDVNDHYGTTIVLIEHDMGVVMDISDRVVVLDYGKKIGDGTPDEVRSNQDVIDAYLGVATLRTAQCSNFWFFIEVLVGGLLSGIDVLAGRARLRAHLQGLVGVQLRAGRDGVLRRPVLCRLHGARPAVLGGAAGHRRR